MKLKTDLRIFVHKITTMLCSNLLLLTQIIKALKREIHCKKNVRFSRPLARMSSTPWSKNNVIIQGVLDILTGDGQTTHFFTVYNMRCRKLFEKTPWNAAQDTGLSIFFA